MTTHTIASLLRAYRNGETTPEKVINDVLASCDLQQEHNIWITRLTRAQIQPYLDALQTKSANELPLYGIPFAIKDNIDLAGVPTTAACPAFRYTPNQSAFVVQQLINAGAIPIGKTNMDQFATGLVGTRSPYGACKNAFNKKYISGGSSSGSAVATALGLVSFALGTDTAGSGRVPAAFNNIVGLKPTRGLLSMQGVVPACRSLDCVSIFALTCDDANTVLNVAAQYDAEDDYARKNRFDNNTRHYGVSATPFTFAVPQDSQLNFFGNTAARQLFQQAIKKLEVLGGIMTTIDFTPFLEAAKLLYQGPWVAERYAAIETIITQQPDALLPVIRDIIGDAVNKSAVDVFKAQYALQHFRAQAEKIFAAIDILVTPTSGTIYSIEKVQHDPVALNSRLGYYTNFMNLLDCCAVAAPAGFLDNGLPWGITFVSTALQDRRCLSFANLWQQHIGQTLGATTLSITGTTNVQTYANTLSVVVCGAHLQGLPLNWQLTERGGTFIEKTTTSKSYRMFALPGGPPYRPGLIRDEQNGCTIEVEVWTLPKAEFGGFVAAIPAPLGIGKVELKDRRWLSGFICETYAINGAEDISRHGGWRKYIEAQQKR